MTTSQRIILNTSVTYGRSILGLALGLFSTRWVLQSLGDVNFGLYSIVGSVIVFVTFLNGVVSGSIARFYAYSIGSNEMLSAREAEESLKEWFNVALSIHTILPLFLIVIGYPLGLYAIEHWLNIPMDKVSACVWVFRIALCTAFINMISAPFTAMYVAHQYIVELALFGLLASILNFTCAYYLTLIAGDRLVIYAFCMMLLNAGIPLLQVIRTVVKFKACRISFVYWRSFERLKVVFSFVGWQLFGSMGALLRGQGVAILINLYFGPKVNTAFGIANTLSAHTSTLSQSLIGALQPALTTCEGSGDREGMLGLAIKTCKYGTTLVMFFAIPLLLEMDYVLHLWLKTPPAYAGSLCMFMIAMLIIDKMTTGHMLAIAAQGKIASYQAVLGSSLILTLPIAWFMIHVGWGVLSIGYAYILTMSFCSLGRIFFTKLQLGMSPMGWVRQILFPISFLLFCSGVVGYFPRIFLEPSFERLCFTIVLTFVTSIPIIWIVILDQSERVYIQSQVRNIFTYIQR